MKQKRKGEETHISDTNTHKHTKQQTHTHSHTHKHAHTQTCCPPGLSRGLDIKFIQKNEKPPMKFVGFRSVEHRGREKKTLTMDIDKVNV